LETKAFILDINFAMKKHVLFLCGLNHKYLES